MLRLPSRGSRAGAALVFSLATGLAVPARAQQQGASAPLAPTALTLPSGPSSVRGLADEASLDVFTGQVQVDVPVALPAAAAGFAPTLALHYDGALGNGPLGVGWSLKLPRLIRSQRHGVPSFTSRDELELIGVGAGGRVVTIGEGRYRVEGHGEQIRVTGDPASGFVVDDGSGLQYRFGCEARHAAGERTAAWLLESVTDVAGQRAQYRYAQIDGVPYLTDVTWGPAGMFAVALSYAPRPDMPVSYRAGFAVRLTRRLAELRVIAHGETRHTMALAYDDAGTLSRLHRVTTTGRDGAAALPPVTFAYAEQGRAKLFRLANASGWRLGERGCVLVDLDGDGIADLLESRTGDYLRNFGDTFDDAEHGTNMRMSTPKRVAFLDLDGDGQVELVDQGFGGGWLVSRLDVAEARWQECGSWPGTAELPVGGAATVFADIDGNGLPDLVIDHGDSLAIAFNRPDGMQPRVYVPGPAASYARLTSGAARYVDVNGDGLADVVGLGDEGAQIYLGQGDGSFADAGRVAYPWGFSRAGSKGLHLADLNRDGLVDLIATSHGHVAWYAGRADGGWASEAVELSPPGGAAHVAIGDVNGNGSLDLVWSSGWAADLAGATHAGMLSAIDNGFGGTTRFTYASSTALMVRAEREQRPWTHKVPAALPVVVQIDHEVANSPTRTTRIDLRDAAWDHRERRFAGFLGATQTTVGDSPKTTLVEVSRFIEGVDADRVLRGRVASVQQAALDDALPLVSETRTWRTALPETLASDAATPLLRVPILTETRTCRAGDGHAAAVELLTQFAHDGEGHVVKTVSHGRTDRLGDESTVTRRLAHSDAHWIRGVVVEEALLSGTAGGEPIAIERRTFDGDGTPLPFGQVEAGRLRRTDAWLASEKRWVRRSEIDYDVLGNPIRRWERGHERRVTYDAAGILPVAEQVVTAPGRALMWSATWDPVLGQPVSRTGPDGVVERVTYDGLGRPVARARGAADPYETYAYDWTAPQPQTVTHIHDREAGERTRIDVADGAGRPVYAAWAMGRDGWHVDGYRQYDRRGQVTALLQPFEASDHRGSAPANVPRQHLSHDALGRITEVRLPSGGVQRTAYAGLAETIAATDLAPVTFERDGSGRIVRTSRSVAGVAEIAEAAYDAADRLVELSLGDGAVRETFAYDSLGRLVQSTGPDHGTRALTWDDADQLVALRNGAGDAAAFAYDAAGRLICRDGGTGVVRYHYDAAKAGDQANTAGRLAWAEDPEGEVHFAYDAAGNPIEIERVLRGVRAHKSLTYSPTGLLVRSQTDGLTLSYDYDPVGRLRRVGDLWAATRLSPSGGVLEELFGNGVRQQYARDAADRPTAVDVTRADEVLLGAQVRYTSFGALAAVDDHDGRGLDHTARLAYDGAARLTGASLADRSFNYRYDALQNMVAREVTGPQVPGLAAGAYAYGPAQGTAPGPRQLSRAGSTTLEYDAGGRTTTAGPLRMIYDGFDRLVGVTLPGGQALTHVYGFDGERAVTVAPDGAITRRFFHDLVSSAGTQVHRVRVGSRTVATVSASGGAPDPAHTTYHHAALADGATLLTGPTGEVVDERQHEPFGVPLVANLAVDDHASTDRPRDRHTGWVDHGARWSAPAVARWLTPDPVTYAPSSEIMHAPWDHHPYQYLRQSPALFRDPDGRAVNLVLGGVGLVGGGVMGGASYLMLQTLSGGELTWGGFGSVVAGGAVSGGIAGLTGGTSLLLEAGGVAVGSATGGVLTRALSHEVSSLRAVVTDAAVGVATLGIGRAVTGLRARQAVVAERPGHAAPNRTMHEKYLADLRRKMEKPNVDSKNLERIVNRVWRQNARIGNGSTGAALEHEARTGLQVGGKLHFQKAGDEMNAITRWWKSADGRNATPHDTDVSVQIYADLKDALDGSPR